MLTYRRFGDLFRTSYLDSNFVSCPNNKKSTIGYVFMLLGRAVSWKGINQLLIVTSTMEAKYVACYKVTQ